MLRHLVRYLIGRPRLVWQFLHQDPTSTLRTSVDTDFAGCVETRRSTSGGLSRRGAHLIKHWSSTQPTVTLSSAEAELNGICKGASVSLGLQSVARDLGLHWDLCIETDASAAIGVCRRRGLGKIRHLATADLWVQDGLRRGDFSLEKIPSQENTSDIINKHVPKPLLDKHMGTLGLRLEQGRAESAPTIEHS